MVQRLHDRFAADLAGRCDDAELCATRRVPGKSPRGHLSNVRGAHACAMSLFRSNMRHQAAVQVLMGQARGALPMLREGSVPREDDVVRGSKTGLLCLMLASTSTVRAVVSIRIDGTSFAQNLILDGSSKRVSVTSRLIVVPPGDETVRVLLRSNSPGRILTAGSGAQYSLGAIRLAGPGTTTPARPRAQGGPKVRACSMMTCGTLRTVSAGKRCPAGTMLLAIASGFSLLLHCPPAADHEPTLHAHLASLAEGGKNASGIRPSRPAELSRTCRLSVKLTEAETGKATAGLVRIRVADGSPLKFDELVNRGTMLQRDHGAGSGTWFSDRPSFPCPVLR